MLNMIKKQFKLRFKEIITLISIECVTFILGMFILFLVIKLDGTVEKVFELGTLSAFACTLLSILFIQMATFGIYFNNAICMGRARKSFMVSYSSVSLCYVCVIVMVGFIFNFAERILYTIIYPDFAFEYVFIDKLTPIIIVGVILAALILPIFIGTLLYRFGMKAFWIMWAIWMFATTILPRIVKSFYINDDSIFGDIQRLLVSWFSSVSMSLWFTVGGIVLLFMVMSTISITMKLGIKE